MPELIELSKIKDNLYKEQSPVVVVSGGLFTEAGNVFARLVFKNIYEKTITSMLVDIHIFDVANIEIEVIRDYQYFGMDAPRGAEFGGENDISITGSNGKTISVAVKKVLFSDDTAWDGSPSLLYENIPPRRTLFDELEDEDTVAQYKRDFAGALATKPGAPQAAFVPDKYKDLWLCSCGEINHADEEACYACGASYGPQKEMLDNRVQLAANLSEHRRLEAEKAEQARLEAERKAAEAAAAKAEAERLAAEEKARQELLAKRKARNKKIFIAVSIPTLIAIIIFVIVLITYILPSQKYAGAVKLMDEKNYSAAVEAFNGLNGFGDSANQIKEASYRQALDLLEAKKYSEAVAMFKELGDYSDSADKIKDAKYRMADELLAQEKYSDAAALFTESAGYSDSAEKLSLCYFNIAKAEEAAGNFSAAKEAFGKLNEAHSLEMQQIFCDKGTALYNGGKEADALEYFALVTDTAILDSINGVYYAGAMKLIDGKDYDKAAEILEKIKAYNDSATQLLRINYLKGMDALDSGDNTGAIALFEAAAGYEDSADKINLCNYNIANKNLMSGNYQEAIDGFKALGDYGDSASMVNESIYQYGYSQLNNGNVVDAYNTLYAIKGYVPAYSLLVSNSQFYIHVYDVGVGPNPLDE